MKVPFSKEKCIYCKGRYPQKFCGRMLCPLLAKAKAGFKVKKNLSNLAKESFSSESPAPFVGRFGYPNVNVGVLSPAKLEDEAWKYDAPKFWSKENYQIPKLINYRTSLVNSNFSTNVLSARKKTKLLDISQEVSMASKPVDLEVNLIKKPIFRLKFDENNAPTGPHAKLKKLKITSNTKIPRKIDKVVSDIDFKANDALNYLYKKGFDENYLTKLLSTGNLGIKKQRKLVPTRWSITATDDLLGKKIIKEIKDFKISNYQAFFGNYLGNYYLILLFPEIWSYELFESYLPNASFNQTNEFQFMTDYEDYNGRKDYAQNTAGGYYAARLAVLEGLKNIKKQASVLCLRFITGEYSVPLGVWVVREAARNAINNKPIKFSSKELMLKYANALIKKKFGYSINKILSSSLMLKNMKEQKKLFDFMN